MDGRIVVTLPDGSVRTFDDVGRVRLWASMEPAAWADPACKAVRVVDDADGEASETPFDLAKFRDVPAAD